MATTSPDSIWTPDSGDIYDYVIDSAATATSIQTALTRRANSYIGTTSQREAFTATAPEGTLWSDTTGEKILWIKQGASWQRVWPVDDFVDLSSQCTLGTDPNYKMTSIHLYKIGKLYFLTGSMAGSWMTMSNWQLITVGVIPASAVPTVEDVSTPYAAYPATHRLVLQKGSQNIQFQCLGTSTSAPGGSAVQLMWVKL